LNVLQEKMHLKRGGDCIDKGGAQKTWGLGEKEKGL